MSPSTRRYSSARNPAANRELGFCGKHRICAGAAMLRAQIPARFRAASQMGCVTNMSGTSAPVSASSSALRGSEQMAEPKRESASRRSIWPPRTFTGSILAAWASSSGK
jgi:hypothetical protein